MKKKWVLISAIGITLVGTGVVFASRNGKVGVYRVGGLATEAPADPRQIERVGEVQVGRNPVCLAYQ